MPETIVLPALPSMVSVARRAVRTLLADVPRAQDAELVVSELASNVLRHSRSGRDGGVLRIVVDHKPGWTRVEVHDAGPLPPEERRRNEPGEYGRGLIVVDNVSDRWGQEHLLDGACVWAELDWNEPDEAEHTDG